MRSTSLLLLLLLATAVLGEALAHRPATAVAAVRLTRTPGASQPQPHPASDAGLATFYGADFAGLTMADGHTFHVNDPTIAASNQWPLGTRLRVRRLPGGPWDATLSPGQRGQYYGRSIVVTVEDHGNFSHSLDLSEGAFARLGQLDEGVIRVQIEVLGAEPPASSLSD